MHDGKSPFQLKKMTSKCMGGVVLNFRKQPGQMSWFILKR